MIGRNIIHSLNGGGKGKLRVVAKSTMEWELKLVVSGEMALNFAQGFDLSIYALLNQIDWSDDHLKKNDAH